MTRLKGQISDPPKSSGLAAMLLLCLIIIFNLAYLQFIAQGPSLWLPMVIMILPLAIASRSLSVLHFNVFLFFFFAMRWFPHFSFYPLSQLTLLLLYGYTMMIIPALLKSVGWTRTGKFSATIWWLIVTTIVVSCAALVIWVKILSPDLSRYASMIPNRPRALVLLYGLLFCTFNAALEEITWRGVMMEALDSAFGPGILSVVIQAASFALAHYRNGFPNGVTGSLMVFAYGLMLGAIRRKSKGMAAGWLAHAAADFTIYCLVYYFVEKAVK
jgi:membrane protease YdiL (CAAX protease family)